MNLSETMEGGGAAFYAGSRTVIPKARDFITVRNMTSGAIIRYAPVPLESGSIQIRSGGIAENGGASYQLVSCTMKQNTGRWGIAMEEIRPQEWGRVQICGIAVVSTVTSLPAGSSAAAVAPVNGGVSYCGTDRSGAVRVLIQDGCTALVILDERADNVLAYNGYFKLVDASTYDSATGFLVSAAVKVIDGADSSGAYCGYTDLSYAKEVPVTTLSMAEGGTVSLYGWYDSATSKYAVRVDSTSAHASAAGNGRFGSLQLGRCTVSSGSVTIIQDWQGGPAYFSLRYVV